MTTRANFYSVVQAAIRDFQENGYDDPARLDRWTDALRRAAEGVTTGPAEMNRLLRESLGSVYRRMVEGDGVLKFQPGVSRFTVDQLKPRLQKELQRRIAASAQLIKLNREESVNKTLQRFAGWATSVPPGGASTSNLTAEAVKVSKSMRSLPFVERRVLTDQGHKFAASLSEIVAADSGAIAAVWNSNYRQANYDYRDDHKARDGRVYAVRGNWAIEKGLMVPGKAGYIDEVTRPGEEPYCRCHYQWMHALRNLPPDMLTQRGREALAQARAAR